MQLIGRIGLAVRAAVLAAAVLAAQAGIVLAAPRVAVSLLPVHSLVAGVMGDAGSPTLILPAGASPHAYALRPSDVRSVAEADLVVWVGEGLESVLAGPLQQARGAKVLTLSRDAGLTILPARRGGIWEDEVGPVGGVKGHGEDLHLWLDPGNAVRIVRRVAEILGRIDPTNRPKYEANAAGLVARIEAMDKRLAKWLSPLRDRPYIVFHDAYHYFERRYGLNPVGAISVAPGRMPGVRRVMEIRRRLARGDVRCIFREPQFPPAIVDTIVEGTAVRVGVLDPLGAGLEAGPEAYFTLMEGLAQSLRQCLGE